MPGGKVEGTAMIMASRKQTLARATGSATGAASVAGRHCGEVASTQFLSVGHGKGVTPNGGECQDELAVIRKAP